MVQMKLPLAPAEKDCPRWERCSAPLCPISPDLARAVWFPEETICRWEAHTEKPWVKTQAEIARLPGRKKRGYFTVAMLRAIRSVTPDLTGKKDEEKLERRPAPKALKPGTSLPSHARPAMASKKKPPESVRPGIPKKRPASQRSPTQARKKPSPLK